MNTRLVPMMLLVALVALLVSACGGGGGGGGALADLAPAETPVYIEGTIQPEGELSENVQALAQKLAGVEDLGGLIVEELEQSSLDSGEPVDFEKEVEPWLGEKAAVFLPEFDGNDFTGYGVAIETTDSGAAQEFVDNHHDEGAEEASFEGADFWVEEDGNAVGMIDDAVVVAEDEAAFKAAVEASEGEALGAQENFESAMENGSEGSLADVFVDVGSLLESSGGVSGAETEQLLESAGIDPTDATAVASLVPGSDQIEIDVSTNVGESEPADASKLLESLPGGSFAAFATANFGKQLEQAIDSIDEQGVPGEIEPGELKEVMSAIGIDLDKLAGSFKEVGLFAQGNTENNLTGALVITTSGSEAQEFVAQIGKLLRVSGTPGVTFLSGKATGFSVRSPELGSKPVVVAAQGDRIAISYGAAASTQALTAGQSATLAEDPAFKEAKEALGGTPISGFVDGPAALALIENLIPADEQASFEEARPYLDKMAYAAIGAGSSGDLTTSKIIVGLTE